MKNKARYISFSAITAAVYVALTYLSNAVGLANGAIQFRLSEALTILPVFTPAAIPGLAAGCFISNLTTGCIPWDIFGGTMATLIGAIGTYKLKKYPYTASLPPILANVIIVPLVLKFAYNFEGAIPYFMLTVGIGEIVCCGILGTLLMTAIKKRMGNGEIFKD